MPPKKKRTENVLQETINIMFSESLDSEKEFDCDLSTEHPLCATHNVQNVDMSLIDGEDSGDELVSDDDLLNSIGMEQVAKPVPVIIAPTATIRRNPTLKPPSHHLTYKPPVIAKQVAPTVPKPKKVIPAPTTAAPVIAAPAAPITFKMTSKIDPSKTQPIADTIKYATYQAKLYNKPVQPVAAVLEVKEHEVVQSTVKVKCFMRKPDCWVVKLVDGSSHTFPRTMTKEEIMQSLK